MASFKNFLTEYDWSANFADDIRHTHLPGVHNIERAISASSYSTNLFSMINLIAQKLLSPHVSLESFDGIEKTSDAVQQTFMHALKKIAENLVKFKGSTFQHHLQKDQDLNAIVSDTTKKQRISKGYTQTERKSCEKFGTASNPQQREMYIKMISGVTPDLIGEAYKNSIKVKVDSLSIADPTAKEEELIKYIRVAFIRIAILQDRVKHLTTEMADMLGMVDSSDTVNYDASQDPDAENTPAQPAPQNQTPPATNPPTQSHP